MSVSPSDSRLSLTATAGEPSISDKLARKRILDRKAQKAARDRTKWNIENLQYQVAQLSTALISANEETERLRAENGNLKAEIENWTFPGSQSFLENMGFITSNEVWDVQRRVMKSQIPHSISLGDGNGGKQMNIPISELLGDSSVKSALYEAVPWSTGPTCVSDRILQSYVATARTRINGTSDQFLKEQPDITSLLTTKRSTEPPGVSTVVSDILLAYQEINTLPQKVACLYVMYKFLNWLIFRTHLTYSQMPAWLRPVPLQLQVEHPAWIDRIPWPNARIYLIEHPYILFDHFASTYSSSFHVSWPYDHTHVFIPVQSTQASPPTFSTQNMGPESVLANWFPSNEFDVKEKKAGTISPAESAILNPVFEQHLRQLKNWSVGEGFKRKFPELSAIIESDSQLEFGG